jgi:hypothetical protein
MKTPSPAVERFEDVMIEEPPPAPGVDGLDASSGIVTGMLAGSALWSVLILLIILAFR